MTEIFLIRHTQAEGNIYRMMQGHWDGNVTESGKLQVNALKQRFLNEKVDKVYSSDLYRAVYTARAVGSPKGLEVITEPGLREIDVGPWTMSFFGNLFYSEYESANAFVFSAETWQHEGCETYHQVAERVYAALEKIAKENDGKRVAVVSHGISIRSFTAKVTGISLDDTKALPIFRNTSVSTFTYENGVFTPVELNSYYHIEGLDLPVFNKTADLRHEYINPSENEKFYCGCYEDAWLSAHGSLENYSPVPYLKSAKIHYACDHHSIIKLCDGDKPCGLIDLDVARGEEKGIGWVSLLYLTKDYRGKGYGIQALGRPIMFYRQLGRKKIQLHVAKDNKTAEKFYLRHGFEIVGNDGRLLLMEKEI